MISRPGAKLVEKYSRPGPRYTSYPTAPNWSADFGADDFARHLKSGNGGGKPSERKPSGREPLSLYFHIPFCEARCTFCACSVVATPKRSVAGPYIRALAKEIGSVALLVDTKRPVTQLHWGGGTPTYLDLEQIEKLFGAIAGHFYFSADAEISVEIDPRVTSPDQLALLRKLGFNRASLGVQDFNPEVQKEAGRVQTFEQTERAVRVCRELKFESVNVDLVYGLPKQTVKLFYGNLEKVLALKPDRIALFNFAYVPWMQAHQKRILEKDLPDALQKMEMFCTAVDVFQGEGYEFIGLDHFAKKGDELCKAKENRTLHRNFQGYTTKADADLVGMGVTAISYVDGVFAQNRKKLKEYEECVEGNKLATHCGLALSGDDKMRRWVLHEIFCHQQVDKKVFAEKFGPSFEGYFAAEGPAIRSLVEDGLAEENAGLFRVTPTGRLFLRNVGMAFDAYLQPRQGRFSKTL